MNNFLSKIFSTIESKGNKGDFLLKWIKWIVGIGGSAILGAFIIGEVKSNYLNRLSNLEKYALEAKEERKEIKEDIGIKFNELKLEIDDLYTTGMENFEEYRIFNNQQLELIIEFGQSNEKANEELLKKMLNLNSKEKAQQIEKQIESAKRKNDKPKLNINVKPKNLPTIAKITDMETGITTYYVNGANKNYLDTLNTEKFVIIEKNKNEKYDGLFDFIYKDKQNK